MTTVVDPLSIFSAWRLEAAASGEPEADAMALATSDPGGEPDVRFVLLRGLQGRVIRFFTCYASRKGDQIAANPRVAAAFFWPRTHRQVRLAGGVSLSASEVSDAYWARRPRGHQLSGAVSPQSRAIADLEELRRARAALEARLDGAPVPRPEDWGGYDVLVDEVELWEGGDDRFHRRRSYRWVVDRWEERLIAP